MDKNKPTLTGKVKRYANVSRKITGYVELPKKIDLSFTKI